MVCALISHLPLVIVITMTLPFRHPSTILIAGPSFSGKTEFTKRLIKHKEAMFSPPPDRVIWCYSQNQESYRDIDEGVEFFEGLYDVDNLDSSKNTLIIFDDLAVSEESQKYMADIFTIKSHHKNMTACFLTQNIMPPSRYGRTISINSGYFILMKSPRDRLQVTCLARQIYPSKSKFFLEAYSDATKEPHSYLLVDFGQQTDENLRLRSNVFPDQRTTVYISKH